MSDYSNFWRFATESNNLALSEMSEEEQIAYAKQLSQQSALESKVV